MIANKIRNLLMGYKTPRAFPIQEIDKCVDYDFDAINLWFATLKEIKGDAFSVQGKHVLEIGPGADLGVGILFLAMGAEKYSAIDVNPLAMNTPKRFYERLLDRIADEIPLADMEYLQHQLDLYYAGNPDKLYYKVDRSFNLSAFYCQDVDIVFSHATLDAIVDVKSFFGELEKILHKGGFIFSNFDMQTHTRWIRSRDPLNIFRYSDKLYNLLRFTGSPNRFKGDDYSRILQAGGWHEIKIVPIREMEEDDLTKVKPFLNKKFRKHKDIRVLKCYLYASYGNSA